MDFSDTRYAVRIVLLSSVVGVTTPNMLWLSTLILFDLSTWSMFSLMDPSLSAVLFCLALCAVFVWLAVKRMRASKPHRVFLWLARFFGVMVVMGVDSICKAEGIILGGLVVVAGAVVVLMLVSGVIRELGARKKAEPGSPQSKADETSQQEVTKETPALEQEDEEKEEEPVSPLPIQDHSHLKRRGSFSIVGWFILGICIGLLAPLWFLIHQHNQAKEHKVNMYSRIYSLTRDNERLQAEVKYLKDSTQADLKRMDKAVQEALKGKQEEAPSPFPSKISTAEYERRIAICLDLLRDWDTDTAARKRVETRWGSGFIERVQNASPEDRDEILGNSMTMILGDGDSEQGWYDYLSRNNLWDKDINTMAQTWRHFQRMYRGE